MSNYKIPTSESFKSPTPRLRPSGLASRNNVKEDEPKQGPLERFFSLFRSSGGENRPPENRSSSNKAMKFYDASNNKPTMPSKKTISSSPMRIGKAREELDLFEELDVVAPGVITVASGDTLSAIARDNNTTVAAIQKANPTITDPNRINVGQDIKIPSVTNKQNVGLMVKPVQRATVPSRLPTTEERTALSNMKDGVAPKKFAVTDNTKSKSNIKSVQQALTDMGYNPNGVDGIIGGGTARALRKFQHANGLSITGDLTKDVASLLSSGTFNVYPDPPKPKAKPEVIDAKDFSVFSNEVANIESGSHGYTTYAYTTKVGNKTYNKGDLLYGGSGGHYLGKYQMGKDALADVGRKYTPTLNEAFLKDPALQDRLFKKYTMKNHTHLTRHSKKYRNMSTEDKLGVLGYAHNQGATAAVEYLFTGQVGADAFNTKGTDYTDAIRKAFKP